MPNSEHLALDDLAVFLTVVRSGGFRAAAKQLNRAPSTISETISRLERETGTPLLIRSTRSVRTTDAGGRLAERLAPLLQDVRHSLEEVRESGDTVRGPLRLNVPKAVMLDILPPLLERFLQRCPDVAPEIIVEDRFVDAIAAGCHAGIRYGEALEPDMISVPIGPARQYSALAASPAYLESRGAPQHPTDVMEHDCLLHRFSSGALIPWEFERGPDLVELVPPARLTLSAAAAETLIGHAVSGLGLIHTFGNWLEPHFEAGRLVPLLRDWWQEFEGPRLYFYQRKMPPTLRAFIDFLSEDRRSNAASAPTGQSGTRLNAPDQVGNGSP